MSSAPYEEKCQEAADLVTYKSDSSQDADKVPAQTIQHDNLTNETKIESKPPPNQPDLVQIEEMRELLKIGRDWPNDIELESLSHLNEQGNGNGEGEGEGEGEGDESDRGVSKKVLEEREKLRKAKKVEDQDNLRRKKQEIMEKERGQNNRD